jgi:hypothetical protein
MPPPSHFRSPLSGCAAGLQGRIHSNAVRLVIVIVVLVVVVADAFLFPFSRGLRIVGRTVDSQFCKCETRFSEAVSGFHHIL